MTILYPRLYGVATTVNFPLFDYSDARNLATGAVHATGDTVIMKDEGTPANTGSGFVDEGTTYSLALTAAEMSAKRIVIDVIDQTASKVWIDEVLIIETEGNENAQHNRRDAGVILATTIATAPSQTSFTLTDGTNDNNTLLNTVVMIIDNSSPDSIPDRGYGKVTAYTGSTKTITISAALPFTVAAGDLAIFFPTADVDSAADIADAVLAELIADHSGTSGSLAAFINDILADTNELQTNLLTAAAIADGVWDELLESNLSGRQMMRIFLSALAGLLSGAATTTVTMQDFAQTKNRITATVDSSGNRLTISLDPD